MWFVVSLASIEADTSESRFWILDFKTPGPTGLCASECDLQFTRPSKRPLPQSNTEYAMPDLTLAPNVTPIGCVTCLDIDCERVLAGAAGELAHVIIVGYKHDGEFYFASNKSDGPECLWALEQAKMRLLEIGE